MADPKQAWVPATPVSAPKLADPPDAAAGNSAITAVRGRPFEPGVSGNPSGRPKSLANFRLKCQEKTELLLTKLMTVVLSGRGLAQVRAAELILAYAYGRPNQPLSAPEDPMRGVMNRTPDQMTSEEIQRRIDELEAKALKLVGPPPEEPSTPAAADEDDDGDEGA